MLLQAALILILRCWDGPLPSQGRRPMLAGCPVSVVADISQKEVIPAQAGIHVSEANAFASSANFNTALLRWTPAFAGVTSDVNRVSWFR